MLRGVRDGERTRSNQMSAALRYWQLIRLDAAGKRIHEEIASAKAFFTQAFPQFLTSQDVSDADIHRHLLQWWKSDATHPAQLCLRCYISSLLEQACIQLETNFGSNYNFTRYDLFPIILNDIIVENSKKEQISNSSYTSVTAEILQTFNPDRSSLSTWTFKLVKQNRELKTFLIERGVYLVTDWAILNDTTCSQLQRIFSEFHHLAELEIKQASILLESYHAIYRRDRRTARKSGNTGQCRLPTTEQLQQIAYQFYLKTNLKLLDSDVMTQLQNMAERLRQYRIYVRGGSLPTESLDNGGENYENIGYTDFTNAEEEQTEFLEFYRQQFVDRLDEALEQVTRTRLSYLQRQNSSIAESFSSALHLYHCQGLSMGAIAPLIGLQAQYQVTRLLKLKQFRADVRQIMLKTLLVSVLDKAIAYTNLAQTKAYEQQIEVALDEQIAAVIQEVESEDTCAKNGPLKSLFARRLCQKLKNLNVP